MVNQVDSDKESCYAIGLELSHSAIVIHAQLPDHWIHHIQLKAISYSEGIQLEI